MTTTRRMVYARIANAVLAGLPEPQYQEFDPNGDRWVALTFDGHDNAMRWAEWLAADCPATRYTVDVVDTGHALACFYGERMDWRWSITGRESLAGRDQGRSMTVDGNDRLLVPCGRCGHETRGHDGAVCIECPDNRCQAVVLVPAGVEGWPIDGRAQ